jgi:hypothetical protein
MSCIYCQTADATTEDHVPPKNLFPRPRPSNLITVPSCSSCNKGFQQDDDYFRNALALRREVATAKAAQPVLNAVMRSFQRPQAAGLLASTVASMRQIAIRSPAGLHLGTAPGFVVDGTRIQRTLERIVCGLYYHHTHTILPRETGLRVHMDLRQDPQLIQMAAGMLAAAQPPIFIGKVFAYRFAIASDNPIVSVWALEFYGAVLMLGITMDLRTIPPEMLDVNPSNGGTSTH